LYFYPFYNFKNGGKDTKKSTKYEVQSTRYKVRGTRRNGGKEERWKGGMVFAFVLASLTACMLVCLAACLLGNLPTCSLVDFFRIFAANIKPTT